MGESHLERGRGGGVDQMTKAVAGCMRRSIALLHGEKGMRPARVSLLLVSLAVLSVLVVCAGSARADVYWLDCCNSRQKPSNTKKTPGTSTWLVVPARTGAPRNRNSRTPPPKTG